MSQKRSYSALEQLLRQQESRIKQLERELAESRRQTEAAKRSAKAAKTQIKKIQNEVIKPQPVKTNKPDIGYLTKKGYTVIAPEDKQFKIIKAGKPEGPAAIPYSDTFDKDAVKHLRANSYYIPRFINRLIEVYGGEVDLMKLEEIRTHLMGLSWKELGTLIKSLGIENTTWESDQAFADTDDAFEQEYTTFEDFYDRILGVDPR